MYPKPEIGVGRNHAKNLFLINEQDKSNLKDNKIESQKNRWQLRSIIVREHKRFTEKTDDD